MRKLLLLLLIVIASACSAHPVTEKTLQPYVVGTDGRKDVFQTTILNIVNADAVCDLTLTSSLEPVVGGYRWGGNKNMSGVPAHTLLPFCSTEPFSGQYSVDSACSGLFVAPDIIATAKHCLSVSTFGTIRIVCGHRMVGHTAYNLPVRMDAQGGFTLSAEDIFTPVAVVAAGPGPSGTPGDWTLIRVDHRLPQKRDVPAIDTALPVVGATVAGVGYPLHEPERVLEGGTVSSASGSTGIDVSGIDAATGCSGGPLFSITPAVNRVLGILYGEGDFSDYNSIPSCAGPGLPPSPCCDGTAGATGFVCDPLVPGRNCWNQTNVCTAGGGACNVGYVPASLWASTILPDGNLVPAVTNPSSTFESLGHVATAVNAGFRYMMKSNVSLSNPPTGSVSWTRRILTSDSDTAQASWLDWSIVSPTLATKLYTAVSAVTLGTTIYLFATDSNGHARYTTRGSSGSWLNWADLGGSTDDGPEAVIVDGHIVVFIRDPGPPPTTLRAIVVGQSTWEAVGGVQMVAPRGCADKQNSLGAYLVAQGGDGVVGLAYLTLSLSGSTWHPVVTAWQLTTSGTQIITNQQPSIVEMLGGVNTIRVIAREAGTDKLKRVDFSLTTSTWSAWGPLLFPTRNGAIFDSPTADVIQGGSLNNNAFMFWNLDNRRMVRAYSNQ